MGLKSLSRNCVTISQVLVAFFIFSMEISLKSKLPGIIRLHLHLSFADSNIYMTNKHTTYGKCHMVTFSLPSKKSLSETF